MFVVICIFSLIWDRLNIIAFSICCKLISCQTSENPFFTLATKLQGSKCIPFHFIKRTGRYLAFLKWSNESTARTLQDPNIENSFIEY